MFFFVKTECPREKVDELTRKVVTNQVPSIRGNQVYLSTDGQCGYDIVQARNEQECRRMYERFGDDLKILELSQIVPGQEFYDQWLSRHPEVQRQPMGEQYQEGEQGQITY